MSEQPSGTVTFLFTDIEGSTKRWEKQQVAMAKAVARHDELMRAAIAQHRGHVFKTVGDAFCAVFPTAEDAVSATLSAQRAMAQEPWGEVGTIRVRMALHTGEAEERDADYFGPPVNRVARLVSAGHGGQTLLSEATGEQVRERLPEGAKLRSLGKHRLKDLARPERILQLIAAGLPADFPRLKTSPSPMLGIVAAVVSTIAALVSFRIGNRSSSEDIEPGLLSPVSLFVGFKGLVIELSTLHEYVLLAVSGLFLMLGVAIAISRWRTVRRQLALKGEDSGRLRLMLVNQRTVAFLGLMGLTVFGAYAYQQYLWNVALPIPEDALGIAMTREASAATVQEQLADTLYAQGQAEHVIVRQLPVTFDARDTDKARELGDRIGARAVVIYRADEDASGDNPRYVAYVVFTEPRIGLTIGGAPQSDAASAGSAAPQAVVVKEGVSVPVLQTDTLDELVQAAAGIIAYDDNRARKAIEHLELAMPASPDAPNSGILNFYLGNAHNLDNQPELAASAYERAASFYERRLESGEILGPQDQLILVKTYLERGWVASFEGDLDLALTWYQKGLALRSDLLARGEGLERPLDIHASYARLYTLMADAYRFQEQPEEQRVWEDRALDEIETLVGMAEIGDQYALVQESTARVFTGDCAGAGQALEEAIALDPFDAHALNNAGIVALLQQRPDLARAHWERIIGLDPEDIPARELIANGLVLQGLAASYTEPAYLLEAEALYREIIAIDPTNIDAHRNLADVTGLRVQMSMIDSTSLTTGDMLSVSKSQQAWPVDPTRRQAALDGHAVVIEERRILASEIEPGSPAAEASVAEAYLARQMLLYSTMSELMLSGLDNPDSEIMGEQILADAGQIREWSERVLGNPSATRLDQLRAWAARVESLEREWGWYTFFAADEERAAALQEEHRQAVTDAIAFGEAEPIGDIAPLRTVYFKARFIALVWDQDEAAASALDDRIADLTGQETESRGEGIAHYTTFCDEAREQEAGDALLADGDAPGAQSRYETAISANPSNAESLIGLAAARYQQGDVAGAIANATAATDVQPSHSGAWAALGTYLLANGDPASASAALEGFLAIVGAQPPQQRMAALSDVIDGFAILIEERPEATAGVMESVPGLRRFLDGTAGDSAGSYQYPALFARLGHLALYADQAPIAEPLFRRSIELDSHQPIVHADLVISILVQNKDAGVDIDVAFAEAGDSFWSRIPDHDTPEALLTMMEKEASRYVERFPDREASIDSFTSLIPAEKERQEWKRRGIDGNVYTSANYGYALSWDETWTIVDASTEVATGTDLLQISNGASTVQMTTSATDTPEPEACLDSLISRVEGGEGSENVAPAVDEAGQEIRAVTTTSAHAAFLDQPGDGSGASVYYLECRWLPAAEVFVTFFVVVPATMYDQQAGPLQQVLGSLEGPAPASTPGATPVSLDSDPVALPSLDLDSITSAATPAVSGIADVSEHTYTSPDHGFSLSVHPPWVIEATSSEDGTESLELSDGDSEVYLDVMPEGPDDPASCLTNVADELAGDDTLTNFRLLDDGDGDGDGTPMPASGGATVSAVYTFEVEAAEGVAQEFALYVGCQSLPDGAMLRILHFGTPDVYEAQAQAREELMDGLVVNGATEGPATPASGKVDVSERLFGEWRDPMWLKGNRGPTVVTTIWYRSVDRALGSSSR